MATTPSGSDSISPWLNKEFEVDQAIECKSGSEKGDKEVYLHLHEKKASLITLGLSLFIEEVNKISLTDLGCIKSIHLQNSLRILSRKMIDTENSSSPIAVSLKKMSSLLQRRTSPFNLARGKLINAAISVNDVVVKLLDSIVITAENSALIPRAVILLGPEEGNDQATTSLNLQLIENVYVLSGKFSGGDINS